MKPLLLAAASAATLFTAAAASAQEGPWDGFYIGNYAGVQALSDSEDSERVLFDRDLNGSFNDTVVTTANVNAFNPGFCDARAGGPTGAQPCSEERERPEFGVRVGYDRSFGEFLVGGVVEVGGTDLRDSVTAFSITPAYYTLNRRLNGLAAARLRVGYATAAMDMPVLAYATAGGAAGRIDHTFATSNTTNTFTARNDDDTSYGYQVGGGLETQLSSRITFGVEYLFTSLQDDDYRLRVAGGAANNPFILGNASGVDFRRSNEDFEAHSLRVTLGYRF